MLRYAGRPGFSELSNQIACFGQLLFDSAQTLLLLLSKEEQSEQLKASWPDMALPGLAASVPRDGILLSAASFIGLRSAFHPKRTPFRT